MSDDPVRFSAPPELAASTVVWRHRGKLYVTVVAKQSFSLKAGEHGLPTRPAPIAHAESDAGGGRILPDDLAPHVARVDVWVVGSAEGSPGASIEVVLAVRRGGHAIASKTAHVVADASGRAWLGPLGPVSKRWPARARHLGPNARGPLEGNVIAVPDAIDWAYFQTAPFDQQVPWLLPGDDATLDIGSGQRFSLHVPVASPSARLSEPRAPTQLLLMRADGIAIDVDARRADILFRANAVLVGDAQRAEVELRFEDDGEAALAGTLEAKLTEVTGETADATKATMKLETSNDGTGARARTLPFERPPRGS